jgi:hypothetical protein
MVGGNSGVQPIAHSNDLRERMIGLTPDKAGDRPTIARLFFVAMRKQLGR